MMRPLIVAFLAFPGLAAADTSAPAATASSSELTIRLELLPREAGVRYRIIHTFHGRAPARFATGAADRNCESPVDVLVVDGEVIPLFSNLPCGGFAFTSAKEIAPGESWAIEGTAFPPSGARTIAARYAPTERNLQSVEPHQRERPTPKWWTGVAESPALPAQTISWTANTPDDAWSALVAAMMGPDLGTMARYTTPRGLAALQRAGGSEPPPIVYRRWGNGWANWEVRYAPARSDRVEARFGPIDKEAALVFVRDHGTWRLDDYSPGE